MKTEGGEIMKTEGGEIMKTEGGEIMKRLTVILAITALAACTGDSPVMSEGDVIHGVSVAFCERLNECAEVGGYEGQVDIPYCIDHNDVHLCRGRDCEGPTTDERIDSMYQCVEDMAATDCNGILWMGTVPASCEPLL